VYKTLFYFARLREGRNAYRVLVGRLEGMRALGRPMHKWEDNVLKLI